jgi:CheY-like chemotaxis protein
METKINGRIPGAAATARIDPHPAARALPRQKILIVDDKKGNLLALRRILEGLDVDIVAATGGNHALAATLDHRFALAILDVMMPGMDGYELAGHLRGDAKTQNIPIIFLTAIYSEQERIFKGYQAGVVDYIIKPYSPVVLLAKVRIFLELDRAHENLSEKIVALTASEERYKSLVTTIPDIVYRVDKKGRFTFLNASIYSLGYTEEELLGSHFAKILIPADAEKACRKWALIWLSQI